ncbi:MAG: ribosome silencing factor [Rhodothermales bacterium]|nr:ribosome silencing factor [Rhodothermales bacterium]
MSSIPDALKRKEDAPARTSQTPVKTIAALAVEAALDKKALNIVVMDMAGISGVADMFVLCTGESELQVKAIADAVIDEIRDGAGEKPWHKEGYDHKNWILLDYVDLVVHVFHPEQREFYALERLWGDAPMEEVSSDGTAAEVKLLS